MTQAERIEATPAEQLEALCNARDYYNELAEAIRNKSVTAHVTAKLDEHHEKKARRFAAAYDRSVMIQRAMIEHGRSG